MKFEKIFTDKLYTRSFLLLIASILLLNIQEKSTFGHPSPPDKIAQFVNFVSKIYLSNSKGNTHLQLSTKIYGATNIVGHYDWSITESVNNDKKKKEILRGYLGFGMDGHPEQIIFKGNITNEIELEILRKLRKKFGSDWESKLPHSVKGKTINFGPKSEVTVRESLIPIRDSLEEYFKVQLNEPELIFDYTDPKILVNGEPSTDDLTWRVTYHVKNATAPQDSLAITHQALKLHQVLQIWLEPFDGRIICVFYR